jgi:hypothetical protein
MSNDLTAYDDGFSGTLGSNRRGTYLRWNDSLHWQDRDGSKPPSPLLVGAVDEALQRWANKVPTLLTDKPLPDADDINAQIPTTEWERGIDNQPVPPWKHVVIVILADPGTGSLYKYVSPTAGAHIAFDLLKEAVITVRSLRGIRVLPLVNLTERPMKTKFGVKMRPHFQVIDWKAPPGEDGKAVPAQAAPPQLSAPAPSSAPTPKARPKSPVPLSDYTLAVMGSPKPVTTEELLNDSLDDLPWDNQ